MGDMPSGEERTLHNLLGRREGVEFEDILTVVLIFAAVTVALFVLGPTVGEVFAGVTPTP